jgi:hypothetical protein
MQFRFTYTIDPEVRAALSLPDGPVTLPSDQFRVSFYYAPSDGVPADPLVMLTTVDLTSVGPGRFQSGNVVAPLPIGTGAFFQARVWEEAYGPSYEAAIIAPPMNGRLAIAGQSLVVAAEIPGSLQPPIDFGNVNLSIVPEPGTGVLAALALFCCLPRIRRCRH